MSAENEQQGQENGKVQKQYAENLNRLKAILSGNESVLNGKDRVPSSELTGIVDELLKDRKEATFKEVKEGLNNLIENKIKFDRELAQKKRELEQLEVNKMKEFNEASKKIFGKIEGLEQLKSEYLKGLGQVNEAASTEE